MEISLTRQWKRLQRSGYYWRKQSHNHSTTCKVTKVGHTVGSKFTCFVTFVCFWQEGGVIQSPTTPLNHAACIYTVLSFTHWIDHLSSVKYCEIYLVIFALCGSHCDVPGHFDTVTESLWTYLSSLLFTSAYRATGVLFCDQHCLNFILFTTKLLFSLSRASSCPSWLQLKSLHISPLSLSLSVSVSLSLSTCTTSL